MTKCATSTKRRIPPLALIVAILLPVLRITASAQDEPPAERVGIAGSIAYGPSSLSLGTGPFVSKAMLSARLGFRMNPVWWTTIDRIRVTPHVAFAATNFRGMDSSVKDAYAYAQIEQGIEASVRLWDHFRPYVALRSGTHTAEHIDDGSTWNWSGSGKGYGFGFEVPLLAGGSGLDIGYRAESGTFDDAERLTAHRTISVPFRARTLHVGWSGALRGM